MLSEPLPKDSGVEKFEGFDVVIVGAGISGALLAKSLGERGLRVLILEAGDGLKPNNSEYLDRYYQAPSKVPESPYTPEIFAIPKQGLRSDATLVDPDQVNAGRPTVLSISLRAWQVPGKTTWIDPKKCDSSSPFNYLVQSGELPFGSTYERVAGGTARHWLGISLRHLPNDFVMGDKYKEFAGRNGARSAWPNWPKGCRYEDLLAWYDLAEREIGVSGDSKTQKDFESKFGFDGAPTHGYPMPAIPLSYSDNVLLEALKTTPVQFARGDGRQVTLTVTPIPAARNSEPFNRRRACAGNSSCIPICPIQAKYDPTITLAEAENTGNVTVLFRAVACNIVTGKAGSSSNAEIDHIEFIRYTEDIGGSHTTCVARGRVYVLAANAIETPRLMKMSNNGQGITPAERPVGKHLMDHPFYIASALASVPVFPYRGPLVTGGIEDLRDGAFRRDHSAFRVDVSNAGWSLTRHLTAQTLAEDFVTGNNDSGMNGAGKTFAGTELFQKLHEILVCQVSLGFLVEQTPDEENRVEISKTKTDGLGLPRPEIHYGFSDYTKEGLRQAVSLGRRIFRQLGWQSFEEATFDEKDPKNPVDKCSFAIQDPDKPHGQLVTIHYMGAGHIAGTCRMGEDPRSSVVDKDLRSWDFANLYILGSSVFPTLGTANPTLTIAALSLRLGAHLSDALGASPGRGVNS
jgi:glucose dehydrogenase